MGDTALDTPVFRSHPALLTVTPTHLPRMKARSGAGSHTGAPNAPSGPTRLLLLGQIASVLIRCSCLGKQAISSLTSFVAGKKREFRFHPIKETIVEEPVDITPFLDQLDESLKDKVLQLQKGRLVLGRVSRWCLWGSATRDLRALLFSAACSKSPSQS